NHFSAEPPQRLFPNQEIPPGAPPENRAPPVAPLAALDTRPRRNEPDPHRPTASKTAAPNEPTGEPGLSPPTSSHPPPSIPSAASRSQTEQTSGRQNQPPQSPRSAGQTIR